MSMGVIGYIAVKLMRFKQEMANRVHSVYVPSFGVSPRGVACRGKGLLLAFATFRTFGGQCRRQCWLHCGGCPQKDGEAQVCIWSAPGRQTTWRPVTLFPMH